MRRLLLTSSTVAIALTLSSGSLATMPVPGAILGAGPIEAPTCDGDVANPTLGQAKRSGEAGRDAAQKGLGFLQDQATGWQDQHNCYGCHVQAVTVEALSVGVGNQYDVNKQAFAKVLRGMTTGPGGSRSTHGLRYSHDQNGSGSLQAPSKGMGGSAFARYDDLVDNKLRDDLIGVAQELLTYQRADGSVVDPGGWRNEPVGLGGQVQLTTQALTTWRQAYERTADDAWLAAAGKGEAFLAAHVKTLQPDSVDLQTLNYALLGLIDAGASPRHPDVKRLSDALLARQGKSGAWSMRSKGSQAYATGQSLYVLRKLGLTDQDAVVAKGTRWLTKAQQPNGGWSPAGFGKAEAMWAVMGLVSIDVLSLTVDGVADGQHVEGSLPLRAFAQDNKGKGVRDVQMFVDDVLVGAACGDTLAATWNASVMQDGPHVLEFRATNELGQTARRRLNVYAGNTWLVDAGSRWEDNGTLLSIRDLAAAGKPHKVGLQVFRLANEGTDASAGSLVHDTWREGQPGALKFWWDGKNAKGEAQPRAKYLARFTWTRADGTVAHTVENTFVHAAPHEQQASYGQVTGAISFADDGTSAAGATVELVNQQGQVVRRVRATKEGAYNFKNVDAAKYKIRVTKDTKKGRQQVERDVAPEAAAQSSEDFEL